VVAVAGVALALCLLATLYPSWRAARTAPADALRYE
jgi:lipoprotein-releasing system permease protein